LLGYKTKVYGIPLRISVPFSVSSETKKSLKQPYLKELAKEMIYK
jgi:hypothetical protein